MVFQRNAGFGRCYLVSTRHEILSNVDRNLTGTQLRLRKNRNKINPARESANPIPVLLLSFESQTVVFQLFDFHLRKHSTGQWLAVGDSPRGQLGRHRSTPVSIYIIKMLSKLKSGKCWIRLASYPLQYDMETDLDEIIRRRFTSLHLRRMELANIQNPRKGDFRARVQIHKKCRESKNFRSIIFPDNFRCILRL